ncbi:MAG TPA: hypothetical protein VKP30_09180 [Polyangiaceae bacterium]|nr:hypothetical protein [Polyangiaceae bacterium]
MLEKKNVLLGLTAYLREHPEELLRAARQARHMRFGVPLLALKWLIPQIAGEKGPKDVELEAVPPGIRVTATVTEMETELRGSAILTVHEVKISHQELRVVVALDDVKIRLLGNGKLTPLAALIQSGALDLTRIAKLVAHLPTRPAILVEVVENRLVLDFMRLPKLAADDRLRRVVAALSTILSVERVETDPTHLDLALRAFPLGISAVFGRR